MILDVYIGAERDLRFGTCESWIWIYLPHRFLHLLFRFDVPFANTHLDQSKRTVGCTTRSSLGVRAHSCRLTRWFIRRPPRGLPFVCKSPLFLVKNYETFLDFFCHPRTNANIREYLARVRNFYVPFIPTNNSKYFMYMRIYIIKPLYYRSISKRSMIILLTTIKQSSSFSHLFRINRLIILITLLWENALFIMANY